VRRLSKERKEELQEQIDEITIIIGILSQLQDSLVRELKELTD